MFEIKLTNWIAIIIVVAELESYGITIINVSPM